MKISIGRDDIATICVDKDYRIGFIEKKKGILRLFLYNGEWLDFKAVKKGREFAFHLTRRGTGEAPKL